MKQLSLIFLVFVLINCFSCKKNEELPVELRPPSYGTIIFEPTNSSSSLEYNRLIIQLDKNGQLETLTAISLLSDVILRKKVQTFYYSVNNKIDSAIIEKTDVMGYNDESYTENYIYNESKKIQQISNKNDTLDFEYDELNRINKIIRRYKQIHQDSISIITTQFLYDDQENLSKSIHSSTGVIYPNSHETIFWEFDNKVNPLFYLSKKCNFPLCCFLQGFFPVEYALSTNNLLKMKMGNTTPIEIEQSYIYNQFNYPTKIISNWGNYNLNINYTNQ